MPIYAYKCLGCGHQFDKIQRLSDAPLTDCPSCSQPELKKQITAAAFKLTGTGWYETDFKNNKKDPEKSKSTNAESASAESSSKANSDSKSESTTKSKDSKSESRGSSDKGSSNKDSSSKSSSNKDAA